MKTTIELPDELLVEAKKRAADERTTMREIFERALRKELGTRAARGPRKKPRIHWVVVDGGLPPGLDIASREKMTDWFGDDRT